MKMIKKRDLDTFFKYIVTNMNREPANHKLLGKKVYYKKHEGVVKGSWGKYAGVVIVAFRPRRKGATVRELIMKKGNTLDVARPDMVTTRKPR